MYLKKLLDELYEKDGDTLFEALWLVPHPRVGHALQKLLGQKRKKIAYLPAVYTIATWLATWCRLHVPHELLLLQELYEIVETNASKKSSFPSFASRGRKMLQDFSTIDHHLLDPKSLLRVPDEGVEKTFWQGIQQEKSRLTERFFQDWHLLYPTYQAYRKRLLAQERAYPGLYEREASERLTPSQPSLPARIIGVHLHMLTPAVQKIFKTLAQRTAIDLYYQVDATYMEDPQHAAGFHLRRYAKDSLLGRHLQRPHPSVLKEKKKALTIVRTTTPVDQTQAAAQAVRTFLAQHPAYPLTDVAIVLADPQLLPPLLHTLPALKMPYKIEVNYPVTHTSLYGLVQDLIHLQILWEKNHGKYSPQTIAHMEQIIRHPCMKSARPYLEDLLNTKAKNACMSPMPADAPPLCRLVVPLSGQESSFWSWLVESVGHLRETLSKEKTSTAWEIDTLTHLQNFLTPWKTFPLLKKGGLADGLRFFQQEMKRFSLPFASPKGGGIPIVDLPQSLGIEPKAVFLLSMNEGICPSTLKPHSSLLPLAFREAKGYPTPQATESPAAYLFYRLVQQADFLWSSHYQTEGQGKFSEKSRYLWQLEYSMKGSMAPRASFRPPIHHPRKPLVVEKNAEIQAKLATFLASHKMPKVWTPSMINDYLECSLCFYLQHIAGLPVPPITDHKTLSALHFGQSFHRVMEKLYRPYVGHALTSSGLELLSKQAKDLVEETYQQRHSPASAPDFVARTPLDKEILKKVVQATLRRDAAYAPFILRGVEHGHAGELSEKHRLPSGKAVILGGVIDRIDQKGSSIRIVDYKTGRWQPRIHHVERLFTRGNLRNGIALQLFWYSLLYAPQAQQEGCSFMPTVFSARTMCAPEEPVHFLAPQGKEWRPIRDVGRYARNFKENLNKVFQEIFDPQRSFSPSEEASHRGRARFPTLCAS